MQKNIVSARSQGHPRVNDITVNDKILGMTVQPCRIHTNQLVTWKQISRKKDNLQADNPVGDHNFQLLDLDRLYEERNRKERSGNRNRLEEDSSTAENNRTDDKSQDGEILMIDKVKNSDVTWLNGIQNLNQTYLIRDSENVKPSEIFHSKWKPIKHSPRVEFYLKHKEDEICEFGQMKLRRETLLANDEETRLEQTKELKVSIKNEDDEMVVSCKAEESRINDENMENNQEISSEEIEVTYKTEELNINNRGEGNKRRASYEEIKATECNIKEIEVNTENTKETEKMDGPELDVPELDKLSAYEEDEENRQVEMDERIIENTKYTEETERNLSESDQIITSSSFDVMHSVAWNISKKKNFINQSEDYLNFKDKVSQCESSICCNNSLELKENIVTFIRDQPNVNEIISLDNSNNQANSNPEDETLCQSNSCRNSLDLTENIQEILCPASCRSVSPEGNCGRIVEETEIDEENYENLTSLCNKKPKRNSKRLNSEVYSLPRNLKVTANYLNAPMSNIPLYIKGSGQYKRGFSSDNFESLENNTRGRRMDFNTDSDNSCSNDKSKLHGRSIIKTELTTGEGLRKKNVDEFDYGSDNDTARVGECNARECNANDLGSSVILTDYAEEKSQRRGNEIFLNASANFPKRDSGATKRATTRERPVNSVEMKRKMRESMNLLRDSTDSLISSVEFVELASIRRPEANCTYERETIEIIRPNGWSKVSKDLPDIKSDAMETKEERSSERSYWRGWERTSKISRSRLTSVYPAYHAEYKFAKRNPRVRILPPVLTPPLINRR